VTTVHASAAGGLTVPTQCNMRLFTNAIGMYYVP